MPERAVAVGHDAAADVCLAVLPDVRDGSEMAVHQHRRRQHPHHEPRPRIDRQRGERLAAVVAVPDDHLIGAAGEKAIDRGIDLAGEELPKLLILRLGLVLPADAADALGVGDQEDRFLLRPRRGGVEESKQRIGRMRLFREVQMPAQEREGSDAMDRVRAVEELDRGAVRNAELRVRSGAPWRTRRRPTRRAATVSSWPRSTMNGRGAIRLGESGVVDRRSRSRTRACRTPASACSCTGESTLVVFQTHSLKSPEQIESAYPSAAAARASPSCRRTTARKSRYVRASTNGSPPSHSRIRWCCPRMNEKSDSLQRMRLALDLAEPVLADVRVLRRERDEAFFGQARGEAVVEVRVDRRVGHFPRPAFEPVLADDDRAPLAGLEVLRHEQDAVGEHAGPDVEHDLVAAELRLVEHRRVRGFGGRGRVGQPADDLVPDVARIGGRGLPALAEDASAFDQKAVRFGERRIIACVCATS